MTVCLSDSQLHLFLQTQLSVSHIQDCVQGHTPFTVTDAILTYASSNQGLAQAQEDEPSKESSLAVSYESMERYDSWINIQMLVFNVPAEELFHPPPLSFHSPVPHQPSLPAKEDFRPDLLLGPDSGQIELFNPASGDKLQLKEKSLIRVLQKSNQMEAVLEEGGATGVSFFLGDNQAEPESPGLEDQTRHRSCQIQTPVEVHSTARAGLEDSSELEESFTVNPEENTLYSEAEEQPDHLREEETSSLPDLDCKDRDSESQGVPQSDSAEKQVLEINDGLESVAKVKNSEEEKQPEITERPSVKLDINVDSAPQLERSEDTQMGQKQADEQVDDKDEDGHSVLSSNESIIKVSDEESICEEVRDFNEDEKCYMNTSGEEIPLWSADDSIRSIIDVHLNGCPREMEHSSTPQDVLQHRELQYKTDISEFSDSVITKSTLTGGDQTENSDFSIIETSCSPGNS